MSSRPDQATLPAETVSEHPARYFDTVGLISGAVDGTHVVAMRLASRRCANAAAGCSPRSTTGASSFGSRATRRPTTSRSSPLRTNDDGWDTSFTEWLKVSKLRADDVLFLLSVGGSREHNTSVNLVNAIELARERCALIYGVVGSPDGTLARLADVAFVVDTPADLKTPLVESFQAVVWSALVSHPELAAQQVHRESLGTRAQ